MKEKIVAGIFLVFIGVMSIATFFKNGFNPNTVGINTAWRKEFSKAGSIFSLKMTDGRYLQSAQTLMGDNGWLFYKTQIDGDPLMDYQGKNHYSMKDMEEYAFHLVEQRDLLKEQGIRLIIEFNPNKEAVYSEYLPSYYYKVRKTSKLDEIVAYLQKNTDLEVIYTKDIFLKEKHKAPLYYPLDTHWNLMGAFLGVQELFGVIDGKKVTLKPEEFFTKTDYDPTIRDLENISNLPGYFSEELFYDLIPECADLSQTPKERILLVGDSFGEYMLHLLNQRYHADVRYVDEREFDKNIIGEYKPDIIVLECVERYADRLKDLTFF